jgi:glycosyltransferase involved in cell wall biosynthesis
MPIKRAFALDSARDLSLKGRYVSWTALPDRWISWFWWGVAAGLRLIREYKPQVIWSTYPIATALWIGFALHRLTGIPWVADVRDPLTEDDPRTGQRHPPDPKLWRARRMIEQAAMQKSSRVVLVTEGARRIYAKRYAAMPEKHWALIPNGYAEETFAAVERDLVRAAQNGRPLHLLHSGVLYPTPDRDPGAFFEALARLQSSGQISSSQVQVTLRASGFDDRYRALIHDRGLDDIVKLAPPIPYRDALAEMLTADGLLVFQGYTSNPAVPAKLYEYLRARRPIFALVDGEGDTAATLRSAGTGTLVSMESSEQIADGFTQFLSAVRQGVAPIAGDEIVRGYARESRAKDLASLLDEVALENEIEVSSTS